MKKTLFAALLVLLSTFVTPPRSCRADINGTLSTETVDCGGSPYTSASFICDTLKSATGIGFCTTVENSCFKKQQELFSGLRIEWASPTNMKEWNGFGLLGLAYQSATLCLLRDLRQEPMRAEATVPTLVGNAGVKQEIGLLSADEKSRVIEGYHRAKACAPAVGCLDLFTQKFKIGAVEQDLTGKGLKVGSYDVYSSYGLNLTAEGMSQSLGVKLPALTVVTPYGPVSAQPQFKFGKGVDLITAPYQNQNTLSQLPKPYPYAEALDLYGRNPGLDYTTKHKPDKLHHAWISQAGLGSRDPNVTSQVWQADPAKPFSLRPDLELATARSDAEKKPNGYLGADVLIQYSPLGLIPEWLRNNAFITIDFDVFVQPKIDVAVASQFDIWNMESSEWQGWSYSPLNFENHRGLNIFSGVTAATRSALEAGVNLVISLDMDFYFTKIHKKLINAHPRTTVVEKIETKTSMAPQKASAMTQATKIPTQKSFFTTYQTVSGETPQAEKHMQICATTPTPPGEMPPLPQYTPGNPEDLLKIVEYPCNICIGWEAAPIAGVKSYLGTVFPAQSNNLPADQRWKCDSLRDVGCYDICRFDAAKNILTVVKSAKNIADFDGVCR